MPDWTRSMQQTFDYYIVNPNTWGDSEKVTTIKSGSIQRDQDNDTLGSATFECNEDLSDKYLRVYLVTRQDGIEERFSLGTFLCQTPSQSFDGLRRLVDGAEEIYQTASVDGYTPLIELKENPMPLGYAVAKDQNIMLRAVAFTEESVRAPVVKGSSPDTLNEDFVSELDDTRLTFLTDLISNANREFGLDELSRILFVPIQDINTLLPKWTYTDDNSSILYPELELKRDLYSVPNVVEVVYSPSEGQPLYSRVVNDDPNSPISTVGRGREITHRETNPDVTAGISQAQLDLYAKNLLKELSSLEYTLSYSHGYCPVMLGDCVRLNYSAAGLYGVKAKVIRQSIKLEPGCPVQETAVFTKQLWG